MENKGSGHSSGKIALLLCAALVVVLLSGAVGFSLGKNARSTEPEIAAVTEPAAAETIAPAEATAQTEPERYLNISATTANVDYSYIINAEKVNAKKGNLDRTILCTGVKNVSIDVDGKSKTLEDALADGDVTVESLFSYALLDAQNGVCTKSCTSQNGLTNFLFRYPELTIRLVYDIYETPNGEQPLIRDVGIYSNDADTTTSGHYGDAETGPLDKEDWGLTFEVINAAADGITLKCAHSGGQQIGDLVVKYFYLCDEDGKYLTALSDSDSAYYHELAPIPIAQDADTEITVSWEDIYGRLESGSYRFGLELVDLYDPDTVHPLMKNFYDAQVYFIDFTVS